MKAVKGKSRRKALSGLKNKAFQRFIIGLVTVAAAVIIVENGAAPKKYRLEAGESSKYDITAPRDIVNVLLTEKLAEEAAAGVPPVMMRLDDVPIDIINAVNECLDLIGSTRQKMDGLYGRTNGMDGENFAGIAEQEAEAVDYLMVRMNGLGISISASHAEFLLKSATDEEISRFETLLISTVSEVMKSEVNADNLSQKTEYIQNVFRISDLPQELRDIGAITVNALLRPNSVIDEEATRAARNEAYEAALENKQIIPEGARIISYGDIVTEDKLRSSGN